MQIIEFARFHTLSLPLLAILLACGSDPQGGGEGSTTASEETGSTSGASEGPASTGATNPETTDPGSSTSTSGDGSSTSTTSTADGPETPRLDFPPLPDAPSNDQGCRAVDFLFVIDNSGSMSAHQANLIANFPAFIQGIEGTLEEVDSYHVGVTTTDAYGQNVPGCNVLGGLVVNSQSGACGPYEDGDNFMTEEDELTASFSCAANVGINGNGIELPMAAMENAINGSLANTGQCNVDFIRDDALLVVIIITDEYDGPNDPEGQGSPGTAESWYQTVVAVKNDTPENAAAVAFINYNAIEGENPSPCLPGANYYDGVHIANFIRLFGENGFIGGICQPNYGPIFDQVIEVIDGACENFIPPN